MFNGLENKQEQIYIINGFTIAVKREDRAIADGSGEFPIVEAYDVLISHPERGYEPVTHQMREDVSNTLKLIQAHIIP